MAAFNFDLISPHRTVGAEELAGYFRSLEGVKLVLPPPPLPNASKREDRECELFLGIDMAGPQPKNPSTTYPAEGAAAASADWKARESALALWQRSLSEYVRWAEVAVGRAAGGETAEGARRVANELACGLAAVPRDLASAVRAHERQLRMERAKRSVITLQFASSSPKVFRILPGVQTKRRKRPR